MNSFFVTPGDCLLSSLFKDTVYLTGRASGRCPGAPLKSRGESANSRQRISSKHFKHVERGPTYAAASPYVAANRGLALGIGVC